MAYLSVDADSYNDYPFLQNQSPGRLPANPLSHLGNLCRIFEFDDLSSKLTLNVVSNKIWKNMQFYRCHLLRITP